MCILMATVYLRDSGIMLGLRIWIYNKIRPPPSHGPTHILSVLGSVHLHLSYV